MAACGECAECGAPVDQEEHWLCARHRKKRGKSALQCPVVSEVRLLSELVFDFPSTCGQAEAWVRARFAMRACTSTSRVRFVLRAYGIRGARCVARGVGTNDAAVFFERLVTFMCAFLPSTHARIARVVERKYPALALTHIECAERILVAVERATGYPRAFLARADLAPLARRIPLDVLPCVYAAYIRLFVVKEGDQRNQCGPKRPKRNGTEETQTLYRFGTKDPPKENGNLFF